MAEAFKDKFSFDSIHSLANILGKHHRSFDAPHFIALATCNLQQLEMKARSNQIMNALDSCLPNDFEQVCSIVIASLAPSSDKDNIEFTLGERGLSGWLMMPVCDFISLRGLASSTLHFELAMQTLHACTQRFSAEFAIRPWLIHEPQRTLAVLLKWSIDPNVHVRRLASEGSRPYLPWGLRLHQFVKQPELIIPILNKLKDDDSEYVRRSVANSLNDIAKDHPQVVVDIATKWWQEDDQQRSKLLKHACRTLIKQGNPSALNLFGYAPAQLALITLEIDKTVLQVGEKQSLRLTLQGATKDNQRLLIDYAIHYQKANGSMRAKVFKWRTLTLQADNPQCIEKLHSFVPVTTRTLYAGAHQVEVFINGASVARQDFMLKA